MRRDWKTLWVMTVLVGCPAEHSHLPDAPGTDVPDTTVPDADAPVLADYEIYALGECPARKLKSGLTVRPTTVCSGAEPCTTSTCDDSSDCSARAHGRCVGVEGEDGQIELARCEYADCENDADCGAGKLCACSLDGPRRCVSAACQRDDDCASGQHCVRGDVCGQGPLGAFVCTSDADACRSNADCISAHTGNSCAVNARGQLACIDVTCD